MRGRDLLQREDRLDDGDDGLGVDVERTVPFAFLIQSLMICWYAVTCDPAAGLDQRRQRSPWYRSKATPSAADMHAALRDALTSARINAISQGGGESRKTVTSTLTSEAQAA